MKIAPAFKTAIVTGSTGGIGFAIAKGWQVRRSGSARVAMLLRLKDLRQGCPRLIRLAKNRAAHWA
jgi:NAD(P)-dependent dehydrogenase (short-subunit alcohol dehydrogenase family)